MSPEPLNATAIQGLSGVVDSGLAAGGTFLVGLYAVREFEPALLGSYSLSFSAVLLAAIVTSQLVYVPVLALSVDDAAEDRSGYYLAGLRLGVVPMGFASGAITALLWLTLPQSLPDGERVALVASMVLASASHGPQLFARQSLQYRGKPWMAATASLARLGTILGTLVWAPRLMVPPAALPLTALALGSTVPVLVALLDSHTSLGLPERTVLRRGTPLSIAAFLPVAASYVASFLVATLAGPEELGFAEAARVVATPVMVVGAGLSAALAPGLMEAVRDQSRDRITRLLRIFFLPFALLTLGYAVGLSSKSGAFVLRRLAPLALEHRWLVTVTLVSLMLSSADLPLRLVLVSSARESAILAREIPASTPHVLAGLSAGTTGAFARPIGATGAGLVRLALLGTLVARVMATWKETDSG